MTILLDGSPEELRAFLQDTTLALADDSDDIDDTDDIDDSNGFDTIVTEVTGLHTLTPTQLAALQNFVDSVRGQDN